MKEQYIRQIKRELSIPRSQRKEVIRDLQEAFASALEHGETEEAVAARLGSPDEFARNIREQFGAGQRRRSIASGLAAAFCALGALLCWGLYLYVRRVPEQVIGQADAMTTMRVSSPWPSGAPWLLMILGAVFLLAFGAVMAGYLRRKWRK